MAAVSLAAVAAAALLRPGRAAPQHVVLETVVRATFVREVSGTGTVEPERSRTVAFRAPGTVAEVLVVEGQRVTGGAVLARLDVRAVERDLASSRAGLASARAEQERVVAQQAIDRLDADGAVEAAQDGLDGARQGLADARVRLLEVERLYEAGGASRNERDAARTARDEAARQERQAAQALEAARTRLAGLGALAQAQLKSSEAAVAQLTTTIANLQQQRAEATLSAPFAGVVARLPFKVGDNVTPSGQTGVELVDDSRVHVLADFDENRSLDLAAGQAATVTPDAAPDLAVPAVVVRVDPVAARGSGSARLRAEIALAPAAGSDLPRTALRPGYTVTARVVVRRIPDALLVPLEAIQTRAGDSIVYRLERRDERSGVVRRVPVRVLERNATLAAVAEGALLAGDSVAATKVDELGDGQAVGFEPAGGGG